jgi:hypothetical protein
MKAGPDHTPPRAERDEEQDETVLVWNATVARISATALRPDSANDATGGVGKVTPDRGATGGAPGPHPDSNPGSLLAEEEASP